MTNLCIKCGNPARPYSDHCTPCLRATEALDRAMATTYRDEAECCQRCGRKGVPPCKCHDGEQPEYRPDTAFGL